MASAFSVNDSNIFVDIEEDMDTGHVELSIQKSDQVLSITVEAEDLARALFMASPTFATGVGEIAQGAILKFLEEEK